MRWPHPQSQSLAWGIIGCVVTVRVVFLGYCVVIYFWIVIYFGLLFVVRWGLRETKWRYQKSNLRATSDNLSALALRLLCACSALALRLLCGFNWSAEQAQSKHRASADKLSEVLSSTMPWIFKVSPIGSPKTQGNKLCNSSKRL